MPLIVFGILTNLGFDFFKRVHVSCPSQRYGAIGTRCRLCSPLIAKNNRQVWEEKARLTQISMSLTVTFSSQQ